MFIKILGVLDIIIAFTIFLLAIQIELSNTILILVIIILAAKSLPFIHNLCLGSVIDFASSVILLLSFFITLSPLIFLIAAIAIGQKGVFSLI